MRDVRFVTSNDPKLLAELTRCREMFATTLEGRWSAAHGSSDAIMGEQWEFRSEGTLSVTSASPLSGTHNEIHRWESDGPFRVRLGLATDEEDPEGAWTSVVYEFAVLQHDAGCEVVLREVGQDGFWLSLAPLRRVAD
jgi:hypothetical protein